MPKKKTALTIEERLQQALVPAEEQPYELPENWVWCRLNAVAEIVTGGTPSKKHLEYYGGNYPFYKPTDLDQGRLTYDASEYLSEEGKQVSRNIPKYSTAVCCIGSIGKSGYLMRDGTTNQQINSAIPKINSLCLYYYLCTDNFVQNLLSMASATTIAIVNKSKMENCIFPLPPLAEQQRIVERIEELFTKLDEAKEKLQEVVDSFAVRKAAILHKAFTGELTQKWRKENGVELGSWEDSCFGDFTVSQYGYTEKAHWEKVGPKFLRITDIQNNHVDWNQVPWCPIDEAGFKQYSVDIGDIMIARTGATTGKSYLITDKVDAVFASFLIRLKVIDKKLDYNYLYRYMQSEAYWQQITDFSSGIAQPGVNANKLKKIKFLCPSLSEQHEIVRLIDSLLARERKAQETAEQALTSIELMKKAILEKAFRGELGTNKASEASAMELLKQVLEQENLQK